MGHIPSNGPPNYADVEAWKFFDTAWSRMAAAGVCQGGPGGDRERILAAWWKAGRPYDVWDFIKQQSELPDPEVSNG
jgi:hypothetical protein